MSDGVVCRRPRAPSRRPCVDKEETRIIVDFKHPFFFAHDANRVCVVIVPGGKAMWWVDVFSHVSYGSDSIVQNICGSLLTHAKQTVGLGEKTGFHTVDDSMDRRTNCRPSIRLSLG